MAESGPFWIYNPSREWSYGNSRLMENNFHVRFREHFFRSEFLVPFRVNSPATNLKLAGPYLFIPSLEPRRKPPPLRTPHLF